MTITVSESNRPAYPCDICGCETEDGERVVVTDGGLTVEHVDCASGWLRSNFGRESL